MNQYLPSFCHTYPVLRDWLNQYLPSFCHLSSITHNIAQVSSSCHSITSFNMYFNTSNSNDLYHKSRTCQYSVRQHQLTINRIDQSIFCPHNSCTCCAFILELHHKVESTISPKCMCSSPITDLLYRIYDMNTCTSNMVLSINVLLYIVTW